MLEEKKENPNHWKCRCGKILGELIKDNLIGIYGKSGEKYEICAGSIYVVCYDCGKGNWAYAYPFIPIRGKAVSKIISKRIFIDQDRDDWQIWDRALKDNIFNMPHHHSQKFTEKLSLRQKKILKEILKEKVFKDGPLNSLLKKIAKETRLQVTEIEKEYHSMREKLFIYQYPELKREYKTIKTIDRE